MGALRLLVADGNEIARKGLCAFVREHPGWELAAEACNGREAVEIVKCLEPEVAILDTGMPLLNGLEATRQIAKSGSQTNMSLLTLHYAGVPIEQALDAGAHGYLLKSGTVHDLISAVEALHHGRMFFTAPVRQFVVNRYSQPMRKDRPADYGQAQRLTPRQLEVVKLLAEGHSSKQVAVALQIRPKTAETHRSNVMRRIDCHSTAGLVRCAIRNHIIEA
jgi:DNA-binding NarL/FixJ family response regulator